MPPKLLICNIAIVLLMLIKNSLVFFVDDMVYKCNNNMQQ